MKQKTDDLVHLLLQAVKDPKDCPCDALHVFATNKEVHRHNTETIHALHADIITIDAEDYRKDPRTRGMKRQKKPVTGKKDDLPDTIQIALGVRIMVTRNLDVEDGLCNGCFGKISHIVSKTKDGVDTVHMLGLQLNNPNAGKKHRKRVQGEEDDLYIERSEESLRKGAVRRQFPIKLAYACTAHKVQGMTMENAVVSLKKIFRAGNGLRCPQQNDLASWTTHYGLQRKEDLCRRYSHSLVGKHDESIIRRNHAAFTAREGKRLGSNAQNNSSQHGRTVIPHRRYPMPS